MQSKAKRIPELPAQVKSIALFIAVWWVASLFMSENILPSPWVTVETFATNNMGDVLFHLGRTMQRITLGFIFAMLLGLVIGTLMGVSRTLERWLNMWIMIFLAVPGLVFVVLCFMWFGMNEFATVTSIAIASFPIVTLNVWQGVKVVDGKLIDMARVFGADRWIRLRHVILPQVYPYIMASTRTCIGIAWKLTALVELLGRNDGVGYMLNYWFQLFSMAQVIGWVVLFLIIVLTIEALILMPLEKRLFSWRPEIKY